MNENIKTNVRWSKSVKIITWLSSFLIVMSILLISHTLYKEGFHWIGVMTLTLITFIFIYTILSAPLYIQIDDDYITIKKLIGSKKINRSDVINVYPLLDNGYDIRVFGSGGVFGYTGIFKNKHEGRYISYVGDYNQAFFLVLKSEKKYLLSAEYRELIISIIKEKL